MKKVFYFVNAGLARITSTNLVKKVRNCVTMTTGNAAFATPTPTLASMTALADTLDAANQAYEFTRSKLEKDLRDASFAELKDMLHEFSGYVQATSDGDRDVILSAGLDVRRGNAPRGPLPAPQDVRALVTPFPGRLDLRWKGVRGRSAYIVEFTKGDPKDPVEGWSQLAVTSKNRFTVTGLESNTTYAFRVAAQGAAGASPCSDVAVAKAA